MILISKNSTQIVEQTQQRKAQSYGNAYQHFLYVYQLPARSIRLGISDTGFKLLCNTYPSPPLTCEKIFTVGLKSNFFEFRMCTHYTGNKARAAFASTPPATKVARSSSSIASNVLLPHKTHFEERRTNKCVEKIPQTYFRF